MIYQYLCKKCGKRFEEFREFRDRYNVFCCNEQAIKLITSHCFAKDQRYRDSRGELIHFPADERPYFDKALQKTFHSKKEKWQYLKTNNLAMDGSDDSGRNVPEAGDTRKSKKLYI